MEWLKALLGEDEYNKLVASGAIEVLKAKMGETEYVANDPTKIIPKHVFNEKLAENKLLKTEVEQYKTQLGNVGEMVTSAEMKTKLETQKLEFEKILKEQKLEHEKEQERTNKLNMVKNSLLADGCDANYVDILANTINLDDVIVKDEKILNKDNIFLPMKDTYKKVFEVKVTGNPPPANNGNPPPPPSTKQELITRYNEAEKQGDYVALQRIQREIQSIKE